MNDPQPLSHLQADSEPIPTAKDSKPRETPKSEKAFKFNPYPHRDRPYEPPRPPRARIFDYGK